VTCSDDASNTNVSETRTFNVDATFPTVIIESPTAGSVYNISETVLISTNATDNIGISNVYARVTLPNGSIEIVNLTFITGDNYQANFTNLLLRGRYNITIVANDTNNNINDTVETYFERQPPAGKILDVVNKNYIYRNYTAQIINNASGILTLNITHIGQKIKEIIVFGHDERDCYSVLRLEEIISSNDDFVERWSTDQEDLNHTALNFSIFSGGNYLFKCSDFDFDAQNCSDLQNYTQIRTDLTINQTYYVWLVPGDPGFGETILGPNNISDSWLDSGNPDSNLGGSQVMRVGVIGGDLLRSAIWFNLSSIPSGVRIDDAELSLFFFRIPGADLGVLRNHSVHIVQLSPTRDWIENEVTWNDYKSGSSWSSGGGDFNATATDIKGVGAANLSSWIRFNVTKDVQAFVDTAVNNGWIIKDETENTNRIRRDYRSSESLQTNETPQLTVNFTDITSPTITIVGCTPNPALINQSVLCNATISWYFTYNLTSAIGQYNITWFANDTTGLGQTATDSFNVASAPSAVTGPTFGPGGGGGRVAAQVYGRIPAPEKPPLTPPTKTPRTISAPGENITESLPVIGPEPVIEPSPFIEEELEERTRALMLWILLLILLCILFYWKRKYIIALIKRRKKREEERKETPWDTRLLGSKQYDGLDSSWVSFVKKAERQKTAVEKEAAHVKKKFPEQIKQFTRFTRSPPKDRDWTPDPAWVAMIKGAERRRSGEPKEQKKFLPKLPPIKPTKPKITSDWIEKSKALLLSIPILGEIKRAGRSLKEIGPVKKIEPKVEDRGYIDPTWERIIKRAEEKKFGKKEEKPVETSFEPKPFAPEKPFKQRDAPQWLKKARSLLDKNKILNMPQNGLKQIERRIQHTKSRSEDFKIKPDEYRTVDPVWERIIKNAEEKKFGKKEEKKEEQTFAKEQPEPEKPFKQREAPQWLKKAKSILDDNKILNAPQKRIRQIKRTIKDFKPESKDVKIKQTEYRTFDPAWEKVIKTAEEKKFGKKEKKRSSEKRNKKHQRNLSNLNLS
jgi:hypothetical protein